MRATAVGLAICIILSGCFSTKPGSPVDDAEPPVFDEPVAEPEPRDPRFDDNRSLPFESIEDVEPLKVYLHDCVVLEFGFFIAEGSAHEMVQQPFVPVRHVHLADMFETLSSAEVLHWKCEVILPNQTVIHAHMTWITNWIKDPREMFEELSSYPYSRVPYIYEILVDSPLLAEVLIDQGLPVREEPILHEDPFRDGILPSDLTGGHAVMHGPYAIVVAVAGNQFVTHFGHERPYVAMNETGHPLALWVSFPRPNDGTAIGRAFVLASEGPVAPLVYGDHQTVLATQDIGMDATLAETILLTPK